MDAESLKTLITLAAALSQLGVAAAAYRLGSKVAVRQDKHEVDDKAFQAEVRSALGIS